MTSEELLARIAELPPTPEVPRIHNNMIVGSWVSLYQASRDRLSLLLEVNREYLWAIEALQQANSDYLQFRAISSELADRLHREHNETLANLRTVTEKLAMRGIGIVKHG